MSKLLMVTSNIYLSILQGNCDSSKAFTIEWWMNINDYGISPYISIGNCINIDFAKGATWIFEIGRAHV